MTFMRGVVVKMRWRNFCVLCLGLNLFACRTEDNKDGREQKRGAMAEQELEKEADQEAGLDEAELDPTRIESQIGKSSSVAKCSTPNKVIAFYYGWYAPPQFGGWKGPEVSHGDRPSYGFYDSLDESKIEHDIKTAKQAGIDGFAVAWIGSHPRDAAKDKPNQVMQTIARLGVKHQFCVAALFETEIIKSEFRLDVTAQVGELAKVIRSMPGNFMQVAGKPLVFIWKNELLQPGIWRTAMQQHQLYLVGDGGPRAEALQAYRAGAYANVYYYSTWWDGSMAAQKNAWQAVQNGTTFVTVSNGFRDPFGTFRYGRWRDGSTRVYESQWQIALQAKASYVVITSFNEWPEGHYIEASEKFGTKYLELTRDYVRQYHQ